MSRATKAAIPAGSKCCACCGKCKPLDQFYRSAKSRDGKGSWCRTCMRIECAVRRARPESKAQQAAYRVRPEIRERRQEYDRARSRSPAGRARAQAYRRTILGRLYHARSAIVSRLRREVDPGRRARLESILAQHNAEIARAQAAMGKESDAG